VASFCSVQGWCSVARASDQLKNFVKIRETQRLAAPTLGSSDVGDMHKMNQ